MKFYIIHQELIEFKICPRSSFNENNHGKLSNLIKFSLKFLRLFGRESFTFTMNLNRLPGLTAYHYNRIILSSNNVIKCQPSAWERELIIYWCWSVDNQDLLDSCQKMYQMFRLIIHWDNNSIIKCHQIQVDGKLMKSKRLIVLVWFSSSNKKQINITK